MKDVPTSSIVQSAFQSRELFDDEKLLELAESIKSVGFIQPPLVKKINASTYELIAGERRLRAAKLLGLKMIPVIIQKENTPASPQQTLVENIQREDLNPIEIAIGIQKLIETFNLSQEEVAKKLGKKRSSISNFLRLLSLPKAIQLGIKKKLLSFGHAKVLLSLKNQNQQLSYFDQALKESLSVRELEKSIDKKTTMKTLPVKKQNIHISELEDKLRNLFRTKVSIRGSTKKGEISLQYYSLEDLNNLIDLLLKKEKTELL